MFFGEEVGSTPPSIDRLSDEVVGGGVRKEEVVIYSMYAWVREAVVLRSGTMRRRVRRGGERDRGRVKEAIVFSPSQTSGDL